MNSLYIETTLLNLCFITLFSSMLFYWIKLFFILDSKYQNIGSIGIILSNLFIFSILCLRWYTIGHFPLTNLYESLLFLSWSFTCIHFLIEKWSQNSFIGSLTTPIILFTNTFATFGLPNEMQKPQPLIPALQSNWLMMHVTVMILSYGALLVGSLLSIGFLVITVGKTINFETSGMISNQLDNIMVQSDGGKVNQIKTTSSLANSQQESSVFDSQLLSVAEMLDNLSYRTLGIGFPLLTIGILSGAVWANEAWGSYWSWDPKETWALITWFVFAIYFHTRLTKGWRGKKSALIATFGFVIVWICYLGVNLLGKGLHSYGWVQF